MQTLHFCGDSLLVVSKSKKRPELFGSKSYILLSICSGSDAKNQRFSLQRQIYTLNFDDT